MVVVEAALLFEAKWTPLVDEIWVTTSPEDLVVRRLLARGFKDEDSLRARILSQMPEPERIKYADVVIHNDGSLSELRQQVEKTWHSRMLALKEDRRQI